MAESSGIYVVSLSGVACETNATELPALVGVKEVPVAAPGMIRRRGQRATAQHHLVDHELAVIFAHCTGDRTIPRIWAVGAACPLPDMRFQLIDAVVFARRLPLSLGRQPCAGPARERISLVPTDMTYRCVSTERRQPAQPHLAPTAIALAPMQRCRPVI